MTRRQLAVASLAASLALAAAGSPVAESRFAISFPAARSAAPLDGRLLLMLSNDSTAEPRLQINDGPNTQLIFGIDVEGLRPGQDATIDARTFGYPLASLADVPPGRYRMQALLNRYETFRRSDGHVVKLPPDKGEGQQWNRKPGNLYSTPRWVTLVARQSGPVRISLDQEIPAIPDPPETKYIKHERFESKLLSDFWGRPTYLGAHVLLPEGFAEHPEARYPLVVFHGHFPDTFGGFRETPPDTTAPCEYSERFQLECYNRIQDQQAYQFYKDWTGAGFPRVLAIEIQHPTPFYDDSYAVNSANNGPYGDAIMRELIPYLEERFKIVAQPQARVLTGGSTGGWEALALQVFHPKFFNGTWVLYPDPVDFRRYQMSNVYEEDNAFEVPNGDWARLVRPLSRNADGQVTLTMREMNRLEAVLGSNVRSAEQIAAW